jgi:hypothetical protein
VSSEGVQKRNGNVFADIGVPNADEHFVEAQLVFKIDSIMKDRQAPSGQARIADARGVTEPSNLCKRG